MLAVGGERNTHSFPRQCCLPVRFPQTASMAPVAREHQERLKQLPDVLYGTSESGGGCKDRRWLHESADGPPEIACVVAVPKLSELLQ